MLEPKRSERSDATFMKWTMGVYLSDSLYANQFVSYIQTMGDSCFHVVLFTEAEKLQEYLTVHNLHILVVDDETRSNEQNEKVKLVITFVEEKSLEQKKEYICRFQSMQIILSRIGELLKDSSFSEPSVSLQEFYKEQIISFLSLHDESMILLLSNLFSKEKYIQQRSIFINLLQSGDSSDLTNIPKEKGLSDYIYYAKQNSSIGAEKLRGLIQSFRGLDYIEGVDHMLDLYELSADLLQRFIEEVKETGHYDNILFQFHTLWEGAVYILQHSRVVYLIVDENDKEHVIHNYVNQLKKILPEEKYDCLHIIQLGTGLSLTGKGTEKEIKIQMREVYEQLQNDLYQTIDRN